MSFFNDDDNKNESGYISKSQMAMSYVHNMVDRVDDQE
jgi:hypothetical protein